MRATLAAGLAGLAVFAGVVFAGPATTDSSGNFLMIDVEVSPPQPRSGATLSYHAIFGNRNGDELPRDGGTRIRLMNGFRLNGADFPTCPLPSEASQVGQERCSPRAQVGEGTFEADARPIFQDPVSGTLEVFNGEPRDGNPTLIFLANARAGDGTVEAELDFEYVDSRLHSIPSPEGSPSGLFVVTRVDLELGAERRDRSYVETPRRCGRWWRFRETVFFEGGGGISARDRVPCVEP